MTYSSRSHVSTCVCPSGWLTLVRRRPKSLSPYLNSSSVMSPDLSLSICKKRSSIRSALSVMKRSNTVRIVSLICKKRKTWRHVITIETNNAWVSKYACRLWLSSWVHDDDVTISCDFFNALVYCRCHRDILQRSSGTARKKWWRHVVNVASRDPLRVRPVSATNSCRFLSARSSWLLHRSGSFPSTNRKKPINWTHRQQYHLVPEWYLTNKVSSAVFFAIQGPSFLAPSSPILLLLQAQTK